MIYEPTEAERAEMIAFTQRIADLFSDAANSENGFIAWHKSSWHNGLELALKGAIKETYPDVKAETVFQLIIDSGESVESNVKYWRETDKIHGWCLDGEGEGWCANHGVTYLY